MADDLTAARKELEDEFNQFRKSLEKVRERLEDVERAGPEDDLEKLLDKLEDEVKEARTGGLIGGGAKGHAKALKKYNELRGR
jgi:Skp family chaperone for outer membrane proteins